MHHQDLGTLVEYHYWARDRLLAAVEKLAPEQFTRELGSSFPSVRDTLAHIVGAEEVWLSRWNGHSPTALRPFTDFPDLASIRNAWADLERKVRAFVDDLGEDGVERVLGYRFLSGAEARSAMWQMVQHLVNHASYHRGQVTTMLRQLGAAPATSQDLITFYREQSQSRAAARYG